MSGDRGQELEPSARSSRQTSRGSLHMIGNAHLDPVWLWQWQEGFQAAKSTFRSVLNLMRESDDFLFTSSSAAIYEWIEQNDPEMFREIKQRVAEGRWEIVGGWWIQPDCNLPCGESLVRQGLYGQRYFKASLGVTATVGYNVDSFGHAGSLPQILLKSGLSCYIFTRPHPEEKTLPSRLFWWESDDGSRVLAFRIPYEYNTWGRGLQRHVERCAAELKRSGQRRDGREPGAYSDLMCFYGVGNHGGGPTRENLESIREMNRDPSYPALLFSTPSRYFCSVEGDEASIPVVHDDLQHHSVGCYSAHSGVKRWNRQAENLLLTAEKLSVLASRLTSLPYPADYGVAWKDVLFNQFHDILAGTSIEPAYEDARNLYGEAMAIAGRNLNGAVQALSWKVGIEEEEGSRPIVVFNAHSWPVCGNVELEMARMSENDVLLDPDGVSVPFQRVRSLATVASGSRNRISFLARLPAYGFQVYRLLPGRDGRDTGARRGLAGEPHPGQPRREDGGVGQWAHVRNAPISMENDFLRLGINPDSGCLESLYCKSAGFELLRGQAAKPLVLADPGDTWGHGVVRYDDVVGEFVTRSIKQVEDGPVRSVVRVESEYRRSRLTQDFMVYRALDRVDVRVTVDWHEQHQLLKLHFPLNLVYTTTTYEIPYGHIQRPANGEEEPGQSWVDVTGVGRGDDRLFGLSLLNNGKYSFDVKQHEINLTVLRSPIYAHHAPYQPQSEREYTFMDQGLQRFTYALFPHAGSWEEAGTVKRAAELNVPPTAVLESFHPGPLPQRQSYLWVEGDSVVVSALKEAEDNDDLILRCHETSGVATRATIHLPGWGRCIEATFGPSELKTFRVPRDVEAGVRETNLIEWDR